MPLSGDDMAVAITNAVYGTDSALTDDQKAQLLLGWKAICGAMVNYIKANAEVDPGATLLVNTATVVSSSGGGPCSGVGTITGTGKIS